MTSLLDEENCTCRAKTHADIDCPYHNPITPQEARVRIREILRQELLGLVAHKLEIDIVEYDILKALSAAVDGMIPETQLPKDIAIPKQTNGWEHRAFIRGANFGRNLYAAEFQRRRKVAGL